MTAKTNKYAEIEKIITLIRKMIINNYTGSVTIHIGNDSVKKELKVSNDTMDKIAAKADLI